MAFIAANALPGPLGGPSTSATTTGPLMVMPPQKLLQSAFYVNPRAETARDGILIEESNGSFRKRSRAGCLTCKLRKKKCDEERPACGGCQRLLKECLWVEKNMSEETIQRLRRRVEESEVARKRRKRSRGGKAELGQAFTSQEEDRNLTLGLLPSTAPGGYSEFGYNLQLPMSAMVELSTTDHVKPSHHGLSPSTLNLMEILDVATSPLAKHPDASNEPAYPLLTEFLYPPRVEPERTTELPHPNQPENHPKALETHELPELDLSYPGSPMSMSWILEYASPEPLALDTVSTLFGRSGMSPPSRSYAFTPYSQPSAAVGVYLMLDAVGRGCYDYYRDKVARMVCIMPNPEANFYLKTFLPMAHADRGVLYAILAWAAYHRGGEQYETHGRRYTALSLKHIQSTAPTTRESHQSQLIKLANLLILSSGEICQGDVKKWSVYLAWAHTHIKKNFGGLRRLKLSGDEDQEWLAANFAYHDVMASSISERGTYFPIEDYDDLEPEAAERLDPVLQLGGSLSSGLGLGSQPTLARIPKDANALHGICKPLFNIIGEISTFSLEVKKVLKGKHWAREKKTGSGSPSFKDLMSSSSSSNGSISEESAKAALPTRTTMSAQPKDNRAFESEPELPPGLKDGTYRSAMTSETGPGGPIASPSALLDLVYGSLGDGDEPEPEMTSGSFAKLESLFGNFPEQEDDVTQLFHGDDIDKLDVILYALQKSRLLEAKIEQCKPVVSHLAGLSHTHLQWQLAMFELMQFTARLHLRQSILKINPSCLETQLLVADTLRGIDSVINTPLISSLCFPIFIAGINCVSKTDRNAMRRRFERVHTECKAGNIQRIRSVMEKVWSKNPRGDTIVDWFSIVKRLDWDLSFA